MGRTIEVDGHELTTDGRTVWINHTAELRRRARGVLPPKPGDDRETE